MIHEDIDDILKDYISLVKIEMTRLQTKQSEEDLTKQDSDLLTDMVKTLVTIRKDWRIADKEATTDASGVEDLDAEIQKEIKKLVEKQNAQ